MLGILGGAFVGAIAFDLIVQERGGWEAAKVICFTTFVGDSFLDGVTFTTRYQCAECQFI